jgi:hypothetical protein
MPGSPFHLACPLIVAIAFSSMAAAPGIDSTHVEEIAGWLQPERAGVGPPASNRAAWDKLAARPGFAAVIADAAALAKQKPAELPDDLFLDFSKTGNRTRCQRALSSRDGRLATLALAECLEYRGRFIAPLCETLEAIASEKTWVMPAHDPGLNNFHGKEREMDLRATLVAWDFATVDYLLGDKLPDSTRKLIRENVRGRVLVPFREMVEGKRKPISWMRATHNWNAVCLAGITGAALALEDSPQDRAWYVAVAERYIQFFLSGFTPDGYCSEGVGYWNYGFGRFLMLGEAVRQATSGKLDLLAMPAALPPALYPTRSEIINGIYPTIADCHPGSRPDSGLARYICERFGLEVPESARGDFAQPSAKSLAPGLMFCFLPSPLPKAPHPAIDPAAPARTWFKDGGVLICRPAGPGPQSQFAAVLKGGHNAEHHNHNDVGSFSVVLGKNMVICDPGSEVYTARTFSGRRYDSKVLSSYGHAVPVIGGQLQKAGAASRAVVLKTDFTPEQDILELDIRSAYAVPELRTLARRFVFRRGKQPGLRVRDEIELSAPRTYETALVTWGEWKKVTEQELTVTDGNETVRVRINTGGQPFSINSETMDEDVPTPRKPKRLGIALKNPVQKASVTLEIEPMPRAK